MPVITFALCIGIIAGLRAAAPLAAVSWAAYLGHLRLAGTPLSFLGFVATPWILTVLALGELFNDKRATTPSRTIPPQFIGRIVTGSFAGAAIGLAHNQTVTGLVAGGIGAVIGTLVGANMRGFLARSFGRDLPAALVEDAITVGGCLVLVSRLH